MSDWIDVAAVDDFLPGSCRVVETDEGAIAVFNLDGKYYAIDNTCNHNGGELSEGELDGDEIECPLHGARFSVISGVVLAPPACENLNTFAVRVAGGWIQVDAEGEGV